MTCPKCRSDDRAHRRLVTTLRPDGSGLDTRECPDGWHDGWHDAPPASVEPVAVTLYRWQDRWRESTFRTTIPGKIVEDEYRALPVAAYNALLARLNTATVAADLMRARAERAEMARDEAVGLVSEAADMIEGDVSSAWSEGKRNEFVERARAALRAGGG